MNKSFTIHNTTYTSQNPLIIAELGTAHGADPVKAKELIEAAFASGAGCIKTQIVYADEILHPKTGEVNLPGGKIRLYDRFKQLEVTPDFFAMMKEHTEARGMLFLATPFGTRSARELYRLKPGVFKIASPELNHRTLLQEIASYQSPVLLSTGVSRIADIENALGLLTRVPVCLLHCVTAYPAPETDYNLQVLESLSRIFGTPIGLSDHSLDPELVPALSIAVGAVAVEKHFCLSREDSGLDDPIALGPDSFLRMVKAIRLAGVQSPQETIAALAKERGADVVQTILGNGVKQLAKSEATNYRRTNRSIHAVRDIEPGEIITAHIIAILRTEKILRPGLDPVWERDIIGRPARNYIPAGEGIRFEDI
ncbi:MAG: N-acetylneuraminate synthase family protein [Spirochaetaceae bacterium]|nr:N-acetylneuraminate synthase family protein [Spirochaetaceae bacterium]